MPNRSFIFALLILTATSSCHRNTAKDNALKDPDIQQPNVNDQSSITADEPFRNQPNEFCTVIRKLDAGYYMQGKDVENVDQYPKKYCLLDACLDQVAADDPIIDLGDGTAPVTTACKLIKVFDSYDEAKAYVDKYKIVDYKFEE